MNLPTPDQELIVAYRSGDEAAAAELFERYYQRLLELIRRKSGWRVKEAEGSVDVAQSVLSSLFNQLRDNTIEVGSDAGLWPLLITITLNKVRNRSKFWQRQRRDASRQVSLAGGVDPLESGPSPEDEVVLADLIERMLAPFSERRRRTVELILQGEPVGQIAAQMGTTERTIYNTRLAAAKILTELLAEAD